MGKTPDYHALTRARELVGMICGTMERMREGLAGQLLDDRREHDCSCGARRLPQERRVISTVIYGVVPATDASRKEVNEAWGRDMMLIYSGRDREI
jgi:hypothetical protein